MSSKHVEQALKSLLQHSKLLVYLVFCHYADKATDIAYPSYQGIHDATGLEEKYVGRLVRELCCEGYLERLTPGVKGSPTTYRVTPQRGKSALPNKGYSSPPKESNKGYSSPPKIEKGGTHYPNEGYSLPPAYENARVVLRDPVIDPVEEDTQIESDPDSRTGEPAASADVCVSLEAKAAEESPHEAEPEPEPYDLQPDYSQLGGPVPATCRHYSEIACPCEQQALRTMTELFKARPTLAKPRRHPNLHVFLHVPGRASDDLKILVEDRLAREKDDDFLKIGTLFSPAKAEEDLAAARARHEAEQAKRRRTICLHPADEVIHDERDDSFVCRACWCTITEAQADKRGVQREGRGSDAEAGLQEFRQAIFGCASNRSQRHE